MSIDWQQYEHVGSGVVLVAQRLHRPPQDELDRTVDACLAYLRSFGVLQHIQRTAVYDFAACADVELDELMAQILQRPPWPEPQLQIGLGRVRTNALRAMDVAFTGVGKGSERLAGAWLFRLDADDWVRPVALHR